MEVSIDAHRTPAIWGISDLEPALEIYPNELFDTNTGLTVLPGDPEVGDFRHRVIGSVVDGVAQFPAVTGIYSTEDSLTDQMATYSAYIRVNGRPPIPWLERFRIPVLTQGLTSWTWSRLRVHARSARVLRSDEVYTKQQTLDAINAAIAGFVAAPQVLSGVALMVDGVALVETVQARVTSRICPFSMDPGITGQLRCEQADIAEDESFVIRSTNGGDTGAVGWMLLN